MPIEYQEDIMEDHHNVFVGYLYVCDGKVIKSDIEGNVATLKLTLGVSEVRRCNPFKRGIVDQMEDFELRRMK